MVDFVCLIIGIRPAILGATGRDLALIFLMQEITGKIYV